MNTKYKITKVEKIEIEGKSFIDVSVDFNSDNDNLVSRKLNFSLDTSEKDIKHLLEKYAEVLDSDFKIGEASKKLSEDNEKAEKTIKSLLGSELSTNKNKKDE